VCRPLRSTQAGIKRVVAAFAAAARRADQIGFDVLEIHGAHGYLIHSFLSPYGNQRDDEYGGSRDGRMRFALEGVRRDSARCGPKANRWACGFPQPTGLTAAGRSTTAWSCRPGCAAAAAISSRLPAVASRRTKAQSGARLPGPVCGAHPSRCRNPHHSGRAHHGAGAGRGNYRVGQADLVALARGMLFNPRWPWLAASEFGGSVFYPKQYERSHPSMRKGDFLKPVREK
jgi:2,4-dienoyl-CoA reductase-like NADH-dependent reductase (Old Yellow Enzyme family)